MIKKLQGCMYSIFLCCLSTLCVLLSVIVLIDKIFICAYPQHLLHNHWVYISKAQTNFIISALDAIYKTNLQHFNSSYVLHSCTFSDFIHQTIELKMFMEVFHRLFLYHRIPISCHTPSSLPMLCSEEPFSHIYYYCSY